MTAWTGPIALDVIHQARPVVAVDPSGVPIGSTNPSPVVAGMSRAVVLATFTRPANTTPYTSGDLVANSATAGSVVPMQFSVARTAGGSGMIRRARLRKTGTTITDAVFRLHLYRASPVATNGDNGAWLTTQSANYVGSIDVICDKVFSDGASGNGAVPIGSEINFKLPSGQVLFGLMEARAAYVPASAEAFSWEIEVVQD